MSSWGAGGGLLKELEIACAEAEKWKSHAEKLKSQLLADRRYVRPQKPV